MHDIEEQLKIEKEAQEAQKQAELLAQQAKQAQLDAEKAMAALEALKKKKQQKLVQQPVKAPTAAKPVVKKTVIPVYTPPKPSLDVAPVIKKELQKTPSVSKELPKSKPEVAKSEPVKKTSGQKQDGIPLPYHDWEDQIPVYPKEHHIFYDVSKGYDVLYDPEYSSVYDHEHSIQRRFAD